MDVAAYTLFETTLGCIGIAWNDRGVVATQLPEASDDATRSRLLRKIPSAKEAVAPERVQATIEGIERLLAGERVDLKETSVDLGGTDTFSRRVYEIARTIPAGSTLSYGDIARQLGGLEHSRDVGQALGANPIPVIVPCHRVIAADGTLGGFSANGGTTTKRRLLEIEGAPAVAAMTLFEA